MEFWQNIYMHFNPIALDLGYLKIHWYGLMYVLALLTALMFAQYIVKKDSLAISQDDLDKYFIYVEIGVILGARLGYIIFYDSHTSYYLTHPWQMFNPFMNGEFVGISGMSYHGALIGFLIGTLIYTRVHKKRFWFLMDIVAIAIPLGYIFGRIGNFLNQELVGRATEVPWGIYVDGILRHPSQLYEALLEGLLIFIIIFLYRKRKKFDGELILMYSVLYGIARISAEIFREPDSHIGFICCDFLTMGQLLSISMIVIPIILYPYLKKIQNSKP
jgi:phosphatidylglycerol:prolipoprotein diacylglycerol transferase